MSSGIIVAEDLLARDFYTRGSLQDVLDEIYDIGKSINTSELCYAWTIGRFLEDPKLTSQFKTTKAEMARMLNCTFMTIERYCTIYRSLLETEVLTLGNMGISKNAVLRIADIGKDHPEESKTILAALLSGDIATVKDIDSKFEFLLTSKLDKSQLLPGGEAEPEDGSSSTLAEIVDAIYDNSSSAGDKIIDAEEIDDSTSPDSSDSLNASDVKAAAKQINGKIVEIRRIMSNLDSKLTEELPKVKDLEAVVMGDEEVYEDLLLKQRDMYDQMLGLASLLINHLTIATEAKMINHKIPVMDKAKDVLNGGLFEYTK